MYTIGEVSKMMNLSVPTIRYYDEEGLLPNVKRDNNGNRIFDEIDIRTFTMINCLKQTGLKIKEIKAFMDLCKLGNDSLKDRLDFFYEQERKIIDQIKELNKCLALIKFKEWYYQTALDHNNENYVKNLKLNDYPNEAKKNYLISHPER